MARKAMVVLIFATLSAGPAGAQSISLGGSGVAVTVGIGGIGAGVGVLGSGVSVGAGGLPGGAAPVIGGTGAGAFGSAPGTAVAGSFALPARLLPSDDRSDRPRKLVPAKLPGLGTVRVTEDSIRRGAVGRLPAAAGTPVPAVAACRQALAQAALPYGAVHATAASAGPMRQSSSGRATAPIQVRIVYARQGAYEVRQSRVECRLAGGQVVGVS